MDQLCELHQKSRKEVFCVPCSIAICSQCLLKNHKKHDPILSEEEYYESCKFYAVSCEKMTHISAEIRKFMASNVEILDNIEQNGREVIEN